MTGPVEVKVSTSRPYSVWIGAGILERPAELLGMTEPVETAVLVGDENAMGHYGTRARAGLAAASLRLEAEIVAGGEGAKTMENAESLLRRLASAGAHRNDVVAALGGGTIGDLTGFVAAVYHRGMPFIQMPTTVLAQVDASIGGKTGVNLPEGKNLAGAFHQPSGVVADVTTLATLPDAEFRSGMAEVVKHGLIDDGDILHMLQASKDRIDARDPGALISLIAKAAAVKARIVAGDETEQGSRAFLNYGHTLGHALETLGEYRSLRHGEAVAIGMMFAAHLGAELGYANLVDTHRRVIELCGLPTGGAEFPFDRVHDAMLVDKKYRHGMRFIVLEEPGKPAILSDVPEASVRKAYAAVAV